MLEELYNKVKEDDADMVICDYYEDRKDNISLRKLGVTSLAPQNLLKKFLQQELHGATWNKLIRKSCYDRFKIQFPINIIRWEDLYVICNFLLHQIKVVYLPKAFYHYDITINEDSIVRKSTMQGLMSQIYFIDYFGKILDNSVFEKEIFIIKAVTKELAFASELISDKEVIELYSEINDKYIVDKDLSLLHISLSLSLKGFPCIGRFLFNIYKNLAKLKVKFKR